MSKVERIPSGVEAVMVGAAPVGAVPYGTVFTEDGEVDDIKSVDRQGVEAMIGTPAVNWRGLVDPVARVAVPKVEDVAPMPKKRGRPKKVS